MKLRIFNINYNGNTFYDLSQKQIDSILEDAETELHIDTEKDFFRMYRNGSPVYKNDVAVYVRGYNKDITIFDLDYDLVYDIVEDYCSSGPYLVPCSDSPLVPAFEWECLELNEYEKELEN